jgi:hypothetical protein
VEKGYVDADELGVGTSLVTRAGPGSSASSSLSSLVGASPTWGGASVSGNLRYNPEQVFFGQRGDAGYTVYNFEVEDNHNYFVGKTNGGICVHNADTLWYDPNAKRWRDDKGRFSVAPTNRSVEPEVAQLAESLHTAYPELKGKGAIRIGLERVHTDGRTIEVDMVLNNAIVEVKRSGKGITSQLIDRTNSGINPLGLQVVGWAPNGGGSVVRGVAQEAARSSLRMKMFAGPGSLNDVVRHLKP